MDDQGEVIAWWNPDANGGKGAIELSEAVLEGRVALDFTRHAALFVPGDPNWIKAQTEASLATKFLRWPLPFDPRGGGMMWMKRNPRGKAKWLCVAGMPEGTVIVAPISGRVEVWGGDTDKSLKVINEESGWWFSLSFSPSFSFDPREDKGIQQISGNTALGSPLLHIVDASAYIEDNRKEFGDIYPQFNISAIIYDRQQKRWIRHNPLKMILRDDKGRLVFVP